MATRERVRAIAQLVEVFGESPSRLNDVYEILLANDVTLETFSGLAPETLSGRMLFSREQVDRFQECAIAAARISGRIDHPRLSVIAKGDVTWPARADCSPAREMMPWLTVFGDPSMLSAPAIGIGGSRNATPRSLEVTADLVRELVSRDRVVVSGGARGVDAAAHQTALVHGGRTVVVLAQGLGTFQIPSHWWRQIERGRLAVVSEFSPAAGWESHRALQRNATAARLSDAFVVIQAEEMSGTLSAGRSALRVRRPLYVTTRVGSFAGNDQLLAAGGRPLAMPDDGKLAPDALDAMLRHGPETGQASGQMRLF